VPVFKNARLVGRLGSLPRLVGRLRSLPRLVTDSADVVPANRGRLTLLVGREGRQGPCGDYPRLHKLVAKIN